MDAIADGLVIFGALLFFGSLLGVVVIFSQPAYLPWLPAVGAAALSVFMLVSGYQLQVAANRVEVELDGADDLDAVRRQVDSLTDLVGRIEANTARTAAALENLTKRKA